MKNTIALAIALLGLCRLQAQTIYTIDASAVSATIRSGHLKMGNPGPAGKQLLVNNRYLSINGQPIIPVMGEVHFTRIPRHKWEDVILKMKACGINVIATYVFWIYHEEIEGQFDWSSNKDFRAFVQLCQRHGLWVYPRIGPWCHGEVRNGGTPDWLLLQKEIKDRSNDPAYQHYADRLYGQVAQQMKGLLYKDGGPIIGVQLENEYRRGKGGEAHILWLKQAAQKYGIDVPMYTVTGWGNASVPKYEVIPLYGAYPDEPWASHLERSVDCTNFRFTPFRSDDKIGNGAGNKNEQESNDNIYPFFTCETGLGIENTDHRRLEIGSLDGFALIQQKIGSGSNLPGYYMFAGGSNPVGQFTTLEENKEETGYYNTNPVISYDFQAAIRESGELNASYYQVKKLHYFLNEFGSRLAPMQPVFAEQSNGLQYAVRAADNTAFLFGINYCRHNTMPAAANVQFSIRLKNETIVFPARGITLPDSSVFTWPVNFKLDDGVLLKYATAQPLCHLGSTWVFVQDVPAVAPELCFDAALISRIEAGSGPVQQQNGRYTVTVEKPGLEKTITIHGKDGSRQTIVVLSAQEAKQAWLLQEGNQKRFIVSAANMYMADSTLTVFSTQPEMSLYVLNGERSLPSPFVKGAAQGLFTTYRYRAAAAKPEALYQARKALDNAQWLRSNSVEKTDRKNSLFHRFFRKECSLDNPAAIRSATLVIGAQQCCQVQVNNRWVNQPVVAGQMTTLDLTGYIVKGKNNIMLAFPFTSGQKAFAARVIIEYGNTDRIEFLTDSSWLVKDGYNYPSYLTKVEGFKAPEQAAEVPALNKALPDRREYTVRLSGVSTLPVSNSYLRMAYDGDKARLYYKSRLVADDFNNGTLWTTGLTNYTDTLSKADLQLELLPLQPAAAVYFDNRAAWQTAATPVLHTVQVVPEYTITVKL